MKKIFAAAVALSMLAPTVASAQTAAQSLSVKSAAVKPVRASAKHGETKALSTVAIVAIVAAAGGAIAAIASGSN
jgi:hypothetical protein